MRAAATLAALVLSVAANAADPVAFVADLEGNASIEGNGKVGFLAELNSGTRLLLGTGAKVAVTYAANGSEFNLRGPGEFLVGDSEVKADKGAAPTRRSVATLQGTAVAARVSKTATASVRMRNVQPVSSRAGLDFPVDTKVATLQPALRWTQPPGEAAEVTLFDGKGKEIWKGPGKESTARPGVKLSAGNRYRWTVMTSKGSLGEAGFETLPAESLGKAAKARANARTFSDRVVHALLLQDLGASQEAHASWQELSRERPDLAELAALAH
jgi:hypothetical protein